ncbi:hypothetical protein B0H12DRAFT_467972 [Mycena haematopus]|nr:hypothetical protein B0H12DRAFT_467972 [Mycena haematopus]
MAPTTHLLIFRVVDNLTPSDLASPGSTPSSSPLDNGRTPQNIPFWAYYLAFAVLICTCIAAGYFGYKARAAQREKVVLSIKEAAEIKSFGESIDDGQVKTIMAPPPAYIAPIKESGVRNASSLPAPPDEKTVSGRSAVMAQPDSDVLAHITRTNTLKNKHPAVQGTAKPPSTDLVQAPAPSMQRSIKGIFRYGTLQLCFAVPVILTCPNLEEERALEKLIFAPGN